MADHLVRLGLREEAACRCDPSFERDRLLIDGDRCPGRGDLGSAPACRGTAVGALSDRDADAVLTRSRGVERRYAEGAVAVLVAAGRFVERVAARDGDLADRAARDPVAAAREAAGRAGPAAEVAAESGLLAATDGLEEPFRAFVGPTVARARVDPAPPPDARLVETAAVETDTTARVYDVPGSELRAYHVEPVETTFSAEEMATLERARERLAAGAAGDGRRAPRRAVRTVCGADRPRLADALAKHTRGYGILEDLFADPAVTDVFAPAPAGETDLRVRRGGETMRTNVRLTVPGARALAARLRRASGRAFSRASPTLDATIEGVGGADRVRAAGVTGPATEGTGFAFRAHGAEPLTLPALVATDTLPVDAAALLSLAVERAAAVLLAGTRGAGKTTALGALLWEVPAASRLVTIEDTPELPVEALREAGRDVQPLHTDTADRGLDPAVALRTALRLGDGALVIGEVRGEEAPVLYEAMQVGAHGDAVLGTIHGDGGGAVRERVLELGVSESSFAATDLVVTLAREAGVRRVVAVEEVLGDGSLAPLYELENGALTPTGRIERGNSHAVTTLATPAETYSDVLDGLEDRVSYLEGLLDAGTTAADAVAEAHERRRGRPP